MHGMEVTLPGGLPINGCIERQARFRTITGRVEQSLIEYEMGSDRTGYVTAVLNSAVDSIGNYSVDATHVADLCVADRQYLMLRLSAMLNGEQMWIKVNCSHCGVLFDVETKRCDLPVKAAGQGYPQVNLQVKEWSIDVRVPTGTDQEHILNLTEEQAMQHLLHRCIHSVNGEPPNKEFVNKLTESDIEEIDQALDDASPAVCNQLLVTCPECNQEQYAELDHYELSQTQTNSNFFYDEIHTLASHYHWSEASILDLPQTRRHLYLSMIQRSSSMAG